MSKSAQGVELNMDLERKSTDWFLYDGSIDR